MSPRAAAGGGAGAGWRNRRLEPTSAGAGAQARTPRGTDQCLARLASGKMQWLLMKIVSTCHDAFHVVWFRGKVTREGPEPRPCDAHTRA